MQNLPTGFAQRDETAYKAISPEGAKNYETLYMSGKASNPGTIKPKGIPADDFNVFATMVYAFADYRATLRKIKRSGHIRHIDLGTGPNLYPFIASLPYADELIGLDIAPANIERLQTTKNGSYIPDYWNAWLEIAIILYDLGSASKLFELDKNQADLYDKLRHWPNLGRKQKEAVEARIYSLPHVGHRPDNPYKNLNLSSELAKKLKPRLADLLGDVEPLADLVGTADIYTRVFFSESIDDNLAVVAHAEVNGVQLAKDGALSVSAHMAKTTGYKGFFTAVELKNNPGLKLSELFATPGFLELMIGQIIDLTDRYRMLWKFLEEGGEERKMVRQDMLYSSAVILCGLVNYKAGAANKFNSGMELVSAIRQKICMADIVIGPGKGQVYTVHCLKSEQGTVEAASH